MDNVSADDNCMICLESLDTYIYPNKCNCRLPIHEKCFESWINLYNTCIICKTKLSTYDNEFSIKLKYFNAEFENSQFKIFLEFIIREISNKSQTIQTQLLKYLIFNLLLGCFAVTYLMFFIVCIGFVSQLKYLVDDYNKQYRYAIDQKFTIVKKQ
jgi:hypothetical protein